MPIIQAVADRPDHHTPLPPSGHKRARRPDAPHGPHATQAAERAAPAAPVSGSARVIAPAAVPANTGRGSGAASTLAPPLPHGPTSPSAKAFAPAKQHKTLPVVPTSGLAKEILTRRLDPNKLIFIPAGDFAPAAEHVAGEAVEEMYMGSVLAGVADVAGLSHFGHAIHVLEAVDTILTEADRLKRPALTPNQQHALRARAAAQPSTGSTPGVWISVREAVDLELPPEYYDPEHNTWGKGMSPALAALMGQRTDEVVHVEDGERYAASQRLATNAPRAS